MLHATYVVLQWNTRTGMGQMKWKQLNLVLLKIRTLFVQQIISQWNCLSEDTVDNCLIGWKQLGMYN